MIYFTSLVHFNCVPDLVLINLIFCDEYTYLIIINSVKLFKINNYCKVITRDAIKMSSDRERAFY